MTIPAMLPPDSFAESSLSPDAPAVGLGFGLGADVGPGIDVGPGAGPGAGGVIGSKLPMDGSD